jgi:hypothetical protein
MYRPPPRQDTITIPALSPDQLFDRRRERDATKLKQYNRILEQIYQRIKGASKNTSTTWLAYNVPPLMISFNTDELEDCMTYIVHMLRQQGYDVRYTYPNLLHISWAKYERDYLLKENPIIQAMSPPEPRRPAGPAIQRPAPRPSTAPRVQWAQQKTIYNLPSTAVGAQPVVAPPKPVAAYQPPASFMNAVDRPLPDGSTAGKSAMDMFLGF